MQISLDKLKSTNKKIQEVLGTINDGLDDKEKNIFLDIAYFFDGEDTNCIMENIRQLLLLRILWNENSH